MCLPLAPENTGICHRVWFGNTADLEVHLKRFPPLSQPSIVQISLSGWLVSLDKTSCVYTGQLGHCMYIIFLCTCHFGQALHLILYSVPVMTPGPNFAKFIALSLQSSS